jgi:hypothetical protein
VSPQLNPSTAGDQLDSTLEGIGDKIVIAIHGIGDQYKNATVRSVVSIFGRCFEQATPVPLGGFYSEDGSIHVFRATAPPMVKAPMSSIGFVEAYWADIPRQVQQEGYTIEETKAWARTVVERVQAQYQEELKSRLSLRPADYLGAIAALEGMIDGIGVIGNLLFLAEKLGFSKFELEPMLTAFIGDVSPQSLGGSCDAVFSFACSVRRGGRESDGWRFAGRVGGCPGGRERPRDRGALPDRQSPGRD